MRNPLKSYPQLCRLILGAILIPGTMIGSGIISIPIPHFNQYFPFLGPLLVILATALLYRTEGKTLSALGLDIRPRNLLFLPLGLVLGIVCFAIGAYATTVITHFRYHLNPTVIVPSVAKLLYNVLPAAAVQELTARGYCFKKLIEMTGQPLAIIITGLVFIAMHDVFGGDIFNGIFYALTLFLGHLWLSAGLLKSATIYLPIGLHWGNNFATQTLFTHDASPTTILYTTDPPLTGLGWPSFVGIFLLANIGFLAATAVLLRYRTRSPQSSQ
jgi:membrane protease YdiL (CAAX protease family)